MTRTPAESDRELRWLRSEVQRMRDLLDRRPAINAGLIEAYMKWSGLVYFSDMAAKPQEAQEH